VGGGEKGKFIGHRTGWETSRERLTFVTRAIKLDRGRAGGRGKEGKREQGEGKEGGRRVSGRKEGKARGERRGGEGERERGKEGRYIGKKSRGVQGLTLKEDFWITRDHGGGVERGDGTYLWG